MTSATAEAIDIGDTERKISIQACNVLNDLRKSGQLCDAVIKCDDGQFPVHRAIMSACSPYFRALFTNGLTETDQREVFIRGVSSDMMAHIIEYAYTRSVDVSSENVERLLPTADQFHVLGLVKECTNFLGAQLAFDNCIGIYNFAREYFCQHLTELAHNFILESFCEIATQSNEILGLSLDQLVEVLDSDDLNVKNEETVFELVIRWVKHNEVERLKNIHQLMRCIRLGLLSTSYFVDHVKSHPYIKDNEACRPIVIEALRFLCDLDVNDREVDLTHPLARPRIPHEVIFAVGGWSGGSPTNVIESYDTRADRWVQLESSDVGPRAYHGCATINHKVYVIGGFDGMDYFNTCRCYDPVERTWSEVSPMNARRCYVSVTVLGGYIYAMGGFDGHVRQNTAERYQPSINQWSLIAPMIHQRSDASACSTRGKVFICGGFNGQECLNSAEMYCPTANQWTAIQGMRNRRSGIGVIALDGMVYAVGGFNGITRLNNAERYDPTTNTWTAIADMYSPRSNFGIEVIDDMVFAIGGFNGITTIYNVECFDPTADEWYDCTDMSIFRSALSCCVVKGLRNVRNYIQRDRQRAENRDRHNARHNAHHGPHNLAQQAAAAAAAAAAAQQPQAAAPLAAVAAAVDAGVVVAAAGNDNNDQAQPMEQDDINNNNNNNGCPLCRGEGSSLALASGAGAAPVPTPGQSVLSSGSGAGVVKSGCVTRSRAGGKCHQMKRGLQRYDLRDRVGRYHHANAPVTTRHQLARGCTILPTAVPAHGSAPAVVPMAAGQQLIVKLVNADKAIPMYTINSSQPCSNDSGCAAQNMNINSCPVHGAAQRQPQQVRSDSSRSSQTRHDVTDDARCRGDDGNAGAHQ